MTQDDQVKLCMSLGMLYWAIAMVDKAIGISHDMGVRGEINIGLMGLLTLCPQVTYVLNILLSFYVIFVLYSK